MAYGSVQAGPSGTRRLWLSRWARRCVTACSYWVDTMRVDQVDLGLGVLDHRLMGRHLVLGSVDPTRDSHDCLRGPTELVGYGVEQPKLIAPLPCMDDV